MIVGVLREVKSDEYRVGLLPVGAELLARDGHTVLVETRAGEGSGYDDDRYLAAGAKIASSAAEVWSQAELIVKVKEPQPSEIPLMRRAQDVFTYFHFAADEALTRGCLERGITAIAYETLEGRTTHGRPTLPLLTPMSEVAGRLSIQEGAKYLEKPQQGRGVLLGGVPGVEPGEVLIIGGGVVGTHAAQMAAGLGAYVTILDLDLERLRYLAEIMPPNVTTLYSDIHAIRNGITRADLVIGAVLIPGAKAPRLIRREDLATMKRGSVIVDVAVDQGGCAETTRATTHANPTYVVDGVVHYCVANMPGAVSRTSTQALTNATLPWVLKLANEGSERLARADEGFRKAINLRDGRVLNRGVGEAHGIQVDDA
ncbi:MAG TPA: alanine dehydrogenase [Myxococcota bacterium]|nr:alanine dehydrogenase [Myxococcota bacterium]